MFDLTSADLASATVLDCSAGGSSFVAEGGAARAVAVDPGYALPPDELAESVWAGLDSGNRMIAEHAEHFDWSWYGDPARRVALRSAAAESFLRDVAEHPGSYLAGVLPHLPLADDSVDLALCSHLLFTWSDLLDADWHRAALTELVRVARREVRLFPLVVQKSGQPVEFLDELRARLDSAGCRSHVREVPYRFQRGGDRMLVVEAATAKAGIR
jgi:hypothetical protein